MSKTKSTGGKRRMCGRECSHCNPEGMRSPERRKCRKAGVSLVAPADGWETAPADLTPRQTWLDSVGQ